MTKDELVRRFVHDVQENTKDNTEIIAVLDAVISSLLSCHEYVFTLRASKRFQTMAD